MAKEILTGYRLVTGISCFAGDDSGEIHEPVEEGNLLNPLYGRYDEHSIHEREFRRWLEDTFQLLEGYDVSSLQLKKKVNGNVVTTQREGRGYLPSNVSW